MAACHKDQRVTVRRRLRERLRRDDPAGARTIFDDRLLPPGFRQRLPERARQHVDGATGGVGHQDAHGPGRERLRINVRAGQRKQGGDGNAADECSAWEHGKGPFLTGRII